MALKDSVLNIIIRAKDLAGDTLRRFRDDVKSTDETAKKAADGGMDKLQKRIKTLVLGFASFQGVKSILNSVLSTGDKFEGLAIQLKAVMGSVEGGETAFEWIREFTANTPLQLDQVTQAFVRAKAYGMDPMDGSLQAMVDQNEKLGGGIDRLNGIVTAFGQAMAKGKLQAEEMNQLIERGVPIWDLLAEATGRTKAELSQMSRDGLLTADVIGKVMDLMGEQAAGAAAANMSRLSGIVSNLKDDWTAWLNTVAESGALDSFKAELQGLRVRFSELAADGTLNQWAKNLSDALVGLLAGTKSLAVGLYNSRGAIAAFGAAWLALKVASWAGQIRGVAIALTEKLAVGAALAAKNMQLLRTASIGLSLGNLGYQAVQLARNLGELSRATKAQAEAANDGLGVWEITAKKIAEFNEQTGLGVESVEAMTEAVRSGLAVRDRDNQKWIAGANAIEAYRARMKDAAKATGDTANAIDRELQAAIEGALVKFNKLAEKSKDTEKAIADMLGSYDLGALDDVEIFAGAVARLREEGKLTASELKTGLATALSKLTSNEVKAFEIALHAAFEDGRVSAEEMAIFMDSALAGAFQRLAVDLHQVETGISSVGQEAINSFKEIVSGINGSGEAADLAGKKIVAAYVAAFDKVKTEAGKAELLKGLREALEQGVISFQQYQEALKGTAEEGSKTSVQLQNLKDRVVSLKEALADDGGRNSLDEVADSAEDAGSAVAGAGSIIDGLSGRMAELGRNAVAAWVRMTIGTSRAGESIDILAEKMREAEERAYVLFRTAFTGASGMVRSLGQAGWAAEKVTEAFYSQQIRLRDLNKEYAKNEISAERYIQKAEQMIRHGDLLNEQDLSGLRAGIRAAQRDMDSLNDSAEDTLENLLNRLDRAKGDIEAAERRRHESEIRELKARLEEAETQGNKEAVEQLREALKVSNELYQIEKQKRADAKREREARARERAIEKANLEKERSSTQREQSSPLGQVIQLRLGGHSANVNTDNPQALLDILAAAGIRSS